MKRFLIITLAAFAATGIVLYIIFTLFQSSNVHAATGCTPYVKARDYGHMRYSNYTIECDLNTGEPLQQNGMYIRTTGTHALVAPNEAQTSVSTPVPQETANVPTNQNKAVSCGPTPQNNDVQQSTPEEHSSHSSSSSHSSHSLHSSHSGEHKHHDSHSDSENF